MAAHALLSPSSASRWLACTPSAVLESQFPDTAGAAAAEGTLAHSLGELLIKRRLKLITEKTYKGALSKIYENPLHDAAMAEHADAYATYVLEQFAEAQTRTKDAMLFLEQKLDLTEWVPDGFGTGDCVIIADGTLTTIDLKYGKGVPVSAVENKQMMLYALGALNQFGHLYDIDTVRMIIYQPRLDIVSEYKMPKLDLQLFGVDYLLPRAELAFKGDGEFVPGEHCRFCKVKAQCRALADHNLSIAKYEFKMPPLLDAAEIADILGRVDGLQKWASAVETFALSEALAGKKFPGYKLVEGRSNRAYSDEAKIVDKLRESGYTDQQIYAAPKILGITALETVVGKKEFNALLSDLIIKPAGKPTLVPETDKRPELNSLDGAKADFADAVELDD